MKSRPLLSKASLFLAFALLISLDSVGIATADSDISLVFRVSVWDDDLQDWELRWIGTPAGPILSGPEVSPESSTRPFVGFAQRFRVEWEASSPFREITGYRHKASQDPVAGFLPPDVAGFPMFDATTSFEFDNDTPAAAIVPGDCPSEWPDCPELLRFASGFHLLRVQAQDDNLGVSNPLAGELWFEINYAPLTSLVDDADHPAYFDGSDWVSVAEGDTVPDGAYLRLRMAGVDPLFGNEGQLPPGEPCCDDKLDPIAPEVRFQARVADLVGQVHGGPQTRRFELFYGSADEADTVGIRVGPFDTTLHLRAVDEHGRSDLTPAEFSFVGGFPPRMQSLFPDTGDSLVVRHPIFPVWPQNDVPYQTRGVTRYWDPTTYAFEEDDALGRIPVTGSEFEYGVQLRASAHPSEPNNEVKSFTWSVSQEADPENLQTDGSESPDLSFFFPPEFPAFFAPEEGPSFFVPSQIWFDPSQFEPSSADVDRRHMGTAVARSLGETILRARAMTSGPGDSYSLYAGVRPFGGAELPIDASDLGRVSEIAEAQFIALMGLDPTFTGSPTRYWPIPGADLQVPAVSAATARFDEILLTFDEPMDPASLARAENFEVKESAPPSTELEVLSAEPLGTSQCRIRVGSTLRGGVDYSVALRLVADVVGNPIRDWIEVQVEAVVAAPESRRIESMARLSPGFPNPFNPRTVLKFELERAAHAKLEIFDLAGRRVRVLLDGPAPEGPSRRLWNGTDDNGQQVASGVYSARLSALGERVVRRLVLLR